MESGKSLDECAYELCAEVWDGVWDDALDKVANQQPAASDDMIAELRRRCPGYTRKQYQDAIAKGMHDSMF
jgi:uncharacterized protein CbrC (UPF0167 family)